MKLQTQQKQFQQILTTKKQPVKQKIFAFFSFLLITIALLIVISIYYHLIKYQAKHLLPFHVTNNKLII